MLLGTYYLLGACYLLCTKYHLLSTCAINRVHDGGERPSEKPWYQEHAVHLMVVLKSNKEELHKFFCLYVTILILHSLQPEN